MLVGASCLCDCVSLVIAFFADIIAEILVIDLVAVFAFHGGTCLFGEFHLSLALNLDSFVSHTESVKEFSLAHFVHLTLHHHDVLVSGTYHKFDIGTVTLFECGIDHEFSVNACYTHFRDRSVEGDIAYRHGGRCCKSGKSIGHILTICRVHSDLHDGVGVVVVREKGAESTVNKTGSQDFVVAGTAFTLGEAAGETSVGREFFFILDGQGHEVDPFASLFG